MAGHKYEAIVRYRGATADVAVREASTDCNNVPQQAVITVIDNEGFTDTVEYR